MFKTCITLVFVMCSTLFLNAQNQLSGVIYDGSGNIVSNALITFSNSQENRILYSDEQGKYFFSDIASGNCQLKVEKDAYVETIALNIQQEVTEFDIYLFELNGDQSLQEIVIQVQSAKSEIEKQGFAVNVIETKDAAVRNIQTNELLDRSVGVRVRQNGGLGSSVTYNLNGMSGNSVKIFIDGLPISTYGASFDLNSIPPALIERIEVYKGVVPIHLSDDALGGAINVVLKKGLRNNVTASASYGSFNTFQTNFSANLRRKNGFTLKASGFYNYSDNDYEVWGKFVTNTQPNGRVERVRGKRFNDAYHSLGGLVEAGFTDVSWADHFTVGLNVSDSYREVQH